MTSTAIILHLYGLALTLLISSALLLSDGIRVYKV